jgi:hypothetical protein
MLLMVSGGKFRQKTDAANACQRPNFAEGKRHAKKAIFAALN